MARYTNLIFQGGGVKGLSYAGALSRMPGDIELKVLGGSSAGAIAAALIAAGHDPRALRQMFDSLDTVALLGSDAAATLSQLRELNLEVGGLCAKFTQDHTPLMEVGWYIYKKRAKLRGHFQQLARKWGLFSTHALKLWLEEKLGNKRFHQICVEDLRIVASNVSAGTFQIFNKGEYPNMLLSEAVLPSACIPVFFEPVKSGGFLVDGGMLSNFPLFLFEREPFPTVGFRLMLLSAATPEIDGFLQFGGQLISTVLDAHDRIRPRPENFHEVEIHIPSRIRAVDFDLSDDDKKELFELGAAAGGRVNWERFSSPSPLLKGLDPKPDKVVTRVLENGQSLFDALQAKSNQPKVLEDEADIKVTIEPDWSVAYETIHRYRVKGDRVFMGGFLRMDFSANTLDLAKASLVDLDLTLLETTGGEVKTLPRFPAQNDSWTKKFVYLFLPPIAESHGVRTFTSRWHIPKEMAATVGRGNHDFISYGRAPRADCHRLKLKILVQVASQLGNVKITPNDGRLVLLPGDPISIKGLSYSQCSGSTSDFIELPGTIDFRFDVSPAL